MTELDYPFHPLFDEIPPANGEMQVRTEGRRLSLYPDADGILHEPEWLTPYIRTWHRFLMNEPLRHRGLKLTADIVFLDELSDDERRDYEEACMEGTYNDEPRAVPDDWKSSPPWKFEPIAEPTPTVKPAQKDFWNPDRCRRKGLCKAGRLCVKASTKGKPAPAIEGRQYCGDTCQAAYPIRLAKRGQ